MQLKIGQRVRVIDNISKHGFDYEEEVICIDDRTRKFVSPKTGRENSLDQEEHEPILSIDWDSIEQEWMKGVMHNSEEKEMKDILNWFKTEVEKQLNK